MKNKSIGLKILPAIIAVAILVIGYLYIDISGNPLDASKINKQSDAYLQENYPDVWETVHRSTDAYFIKSDVEQWDEATNSYKTLGGTWQVYYTDNNDPSYHLYLVYDRACNLIYDGCSDRYLKGAPLFEKLEQEYETFVKTIFNDVYHYGIPRRSISVSTLMNESHVDAWFYADNRHISHIAPYEGPVLDINKQYTMEDIAAEYGEVYFRFMDDVTYNMNQDIDAVKESYQKAVDNLYKRCMEVKDIVKEYNIPFKNISITHGYFEGLFNISREQLFSDELYQFIYDNYTIM